ncbi:MAG: hypothetical protein AABX98_03895 [Nanoarchaeota archaeon]
MMTQYRRALATTTAALFAAQTAYATPQAFTGTTQTQYVPIPAQQAPTIEGLVDLEVSATVAVKATDAAGNAKYNAQGPATGVNRFEYRVDIEATQRVDRQVQEGTETVTRTVTEYVPVTSYELRVWATPANRDSLNDPRDDILLQNKHSPIKPYAYLQGVEVHAMDNNKELIALFPHDGKYVIYTEGYVEVLGKNGKTKVPIRGLESGPSYDVFEVVGTKGLPFQYPSEDVKAWLDGDLVFTKGGLWNPPWNKLVYPLENIMQYEAGKHVGSDFAVMGTGIKPGCDNTAADPCAEPKVNVGCPDSDCKPFLMEKFYIVGADTVQEGKRTIVVPSATSTERTEIQAGQHLVARYRAENHNIRTHEEEASVVQRADGTIALEERVVPQLGAVGGVALPVHGDMFAVERVLYGLVAEDKNNNGKIGPDEWNCIPLAHDATYVEFVPRGHEPEAFAIGAATGLFIGYFLPPITIPGPGGNGGGSGSGGFGAAGSPIE